MTLDTNCSMRPRGRFCFETFCIHRAIEAWAVQRAVTASTATAMPSCGSEGNQIVKQAVEPGRDKKEDTTSVEEDPEVAGTAKRPKRLPLELDAREKPDPPEPDDQEGTYLIEGSGVQDSEKGITQQVADQEKLRAREEEEASGPGREDLDEALAVARECEDGEKKDGCNGLQGRRPQEASSLRWRRTPQPHGGFVPGSMRCSRGNEKRIPLLPFAIPPTVRSIVARACSSSCSSLITEMRILL